MKKMVKTLACVLTTAALLFAVTGCPKATDDTTEETPAAEDWSTEIKNDDVSGAYLNFASAVMGTTGDANGCATAICSADTNAKIGVKGTYDSWAAVQTGVLSIVSENSSPNVLKFVPSDKGAWQWYIGAWLNNKAPDWTAKVMTMKFYVSKDIVGTSDNSPHIKLLFKDTSWGEQKFVDEAAYDMTAGWHTLVVDFKNSSVKLDGTAVAEAQATADLTKATAINEIDLALDASTCTSAIGDGYLLLESVSVADAE